MLSRWKSPRLINAENRRRRYATAFVRTLYRRSGFNALPMIALEGLCAGSALVPVTEGFQPPGSAALAEAAAARLALTRAVKDVIRTGLYLIGIEAPERM